MIVYAGIDNKLSLWVSILWCNTQRTWVGGDDYGIDLEPDGRVREFQGFSAGRWVVVNHRSHRSKLSPMQEKNYA